MNYFNHYERLIELARNRRFDGYSEQHHVVPRCMGGLNVAENVVELTPEEHYVAHQLLVKMHPGVAGLVSAAVLMSGRRSGNKPYGWLRRRAAVMQLGSKASPETRAKMSASSIGRPKSKEMRAKLSATRMGMPVSPEARAKISAARRGSKGKRHHSAETRAKISVAHTGRKRDGNYRWL